MPLHAKPQPQTAFACTAAGSTPTTTDTAPACLAASKSGCKTACGGGCGGSMTARMGYSVSSPTNVCSDNINSGRFLGRARGADSFATYVLGKPDAGNPPVRFDEGREPADSPRPATAYSTPRSSCVANSLYDTFLFHDSRSIATISFYSFAHFLTLPEAPSVST